MKAISIQEERSSNKIVKHLVKAIMDGDYIAGSNLPPERELTKDFGVGRPTIREALQRMEREGWISIRKGQPAQVNDYLEQGNMTTLVSIIQNHEAITDEFIIYLLEIRASLTPAYVRDAITLHQVKVISLLASLDQLTDDAEAYAAYDWNLQKSLAGLTPNPIYLLILNSFNTFYVEMAQIYFSIKEHREFTKNYYHQLLDAALKGNSDQAEKIVKETMEQSIHLWRNRK